MPAAVVLLERMPLTPNGKLDRKALPEPGLAKTGCYEPPEGDTELALAGIWGQLLNQERIGRHDNFFELGGDSILTLQIVARARKLGIRIAPRAVMERQTIAAIAATAERLAAVSQPVGDNDVSQEWFDLTPIQRWLFEQGFGEVHHWNQSLLLAAAGPVDVSYLRRAVHRVVEHHAALRTSFRNKGGVWQQRFESLAAESVFETVDLSARSDFAAAVTECADRFQRSLSLQQPFRAVWMSAGLDQPGRLLLVAHHLVVDGVSWRVLLEDLQAAYRAAGTSGTNQLASSVGWGIGSSCSQSELAERAAVLAGDYTARRAELPLPQSGRVEHGGRCGQGDPDSR